MFDMLHNRVKEAVAKAGGPTKVSNLLGVSNATIHVWIRARRVSNIDYARDLAKLAGMKVEEVRPV